MSGKGERMLFVLVVGSICPDVGSRPFGENIEALGNLIRKRFP